MYDVVFQVFRRNRNTVGLYRVGYRQGWDNCIWFTDRVSAIYIVFFTIPILIFLSQGRVIYKTKKQGKEK